MTAAAPGRVPGKERRGNRFFPVEAVNFRFAGADAIPGLKKEGTFNVLFHRSV